MRDMILSADAREITINTERKIKRKTRKCEYSSLPGTDAIVIVSEPEENVHRISFHKRRRL